MSAFPRLLLAAVLLGLGPAAFAQENFNIDFTAGPETFTGDIILASGSTGPVSGNEVLGYSLSSTLGDPVAFSLSGSSASSMPGGSPLSVINGNLVYDPLPWVSLGSLPGCTSCCTTCDGDSLQAMGLGDLVFLGPGYESFATEHGTDGPGVSGVGFSGGPDYGNGWGLESGTILGTDPPGATAAPEIDPAGALSALTLLVGGLLVLRGRRRRGDAQELQP